VVQFDGLTSSMPGIEEACLLILSESRVILASEYNIKHDQIAANCDSSAFPNPWINLFSTIDNQESSAWWIAYKFWSAEFDLRRAIEGQSLEVNYYTFSFPPARPVYHTFSVSWGYYGLCSRRYVERNSTCSTISSKNPGFLKNASAIIIIKKGIVTRVCPIVCIVCSVEQLRQRCKWITLLWQHWI